MKLKYILLILILITGICLCNTISATPPIITLLSQTPSTIYQNTTSDLNISFGVSHSLAGLNNTSVSFIFRNYDHTLSDGNHSIRVPANDLCAPWEYDGNIIRAANRNETLNFENNDTITGGDIYSWSGLDENNTRLTIIPINSTYSIVNINGTVHDLAMEQAWYLDRSSLIESTKTKLAIHKSQDVLVKFWDAEIFKDNYNFIGAGYTDTSLGSIHPLDAHPISFYKLNDSYDPLGGVDPLDSPYIVFMGSLNSSGWVDHVYSPCCDTNYVRGIINNSYIHSIINTTEIEYLYFTSETPQNKPYYINVTNGASGTNLSFAETDVMWIGDSAPYTPHPFTPNMWFAFIYDNTSFDYQLYVADNTGLWNNTDIEVNMIESGLFPPTKPSVDHFHYLGDIDYDMNGNYFNNFSIGCGVSSDPDGGIVTHNLTLHTIDGTFVAIINNSFTAANVTHDVFADILFNSTAYYSYNNKYTLRLVATDDEGDSITTWCMCSFSLGDENPPISLSLYLTIIALAIVFMILTFVIIIDPSIKIVTSILSGIIFILSGITMFTTDINTYHNANIYSVNIGWIGTLLILIGAIMCLYTILILYQMFSSERVDQYNNFGYNGGG